VLDWVKIIDDPVFLTTGIRSSADHEIARICMIR